MASTDRQRWARGAPAPCLEASWAPHHLDPRARAEPGGHEPGAAPRPRVARQAGEGAPRGLAFPVAQKVAAMLKEAHGKRGETSQWALSTRSIPRRQRRLQRVASREFRIPAVSRDSLPNRTCPGCGGAIAPGSKRCRSCERAAVHVPPTSQTHQRNNGASDRLLPPSLERRRQSMLAVKAANDELEASNRPIHDAAWFRQNVLPGLQRFSLVTLQSVTGLTNGACSAIRRGRVIPHPRHWKALQQLAAGTP